MAKVKPKHSKLNLGSGADIRKGYVNLDIVKLPGVDIVHDIDKFPYPFPDNSFEEIIANHIIEHVEDVPRVLEDLWRISKPNAVIKITTPHHASGNSYGDVTHKHYFNFTAFEHLSNKKINVISNEAVKVSKFNLSLKKGKITLVRFKFLEPLINKYKKLYDYGLCYILRPLDIIVEYEVIKT